MCSRSKKNSMFFGSKENPLQKMSTSHFPNAKDGCIHLLNDELEKLQSITPLGADKSINGIAALPGDPWMKGRCVFGTGNLKNSETITKHHRLRMTLRCIRIFCLHVIRAYLYQVRFANAIDSLCGV